VAGLHEAPLSGETDAPFSHDLGEPAVSRGLGHADARSGKTLDPGFGYIVSKPGRAVVFSGDTCPTERIWQVARRTRNLKAIFLEVSFSDSQAELARDSCHMTPSLVAEELEKMPAKVPVYLYHMKPPSLARIRREIAALREPRLKLLESERSFRF